MLRNVKAVLFDLDGTLIDSMSMWKNIDVEYLNRHNIEMPDDLQTSIEGRSFYETALYFKERFNINDDINRIMDDWNEMAYEMYTKEIPLKPNLILFLDYLKDNNIKIGIGTSNSVYLTEAILNAKGIADYFDSVLTGCMVGAGKPAPDIYLNSAKALLVEPENCLVFEDLIQGIMAGKSAGMKVVAVEDEFSNYQLSEKLTLADYYITDYKEILDGNYKILH